MKAALPPPPRLSRRQPRTRFRDDLAAVQKRPVLLLAPTTENPPAPCERRPLLHECGSLVCVYVCCWENEPATPRDSRRRRWNKSSPISAGWPAASASTVAALGLVFWPARYGQAAALVRSTRESERWPTRTFAPTRLCLFALEEGGEEETERTGDRRLASLIWAFGLAVVDRQTRLALKCRQ